jgi:hypothetical protein
MVHKYEPFELNLYTAAIIYKFSERYIITCTYIFVVLFGGLLVIMSAFLPEMLSDITDFVFINLTNYLRRINPQMANNLPFEINH